MHRVARALRTLGIYFVARSGFGLLRLDRLYRRLSESRMKRAARALTSDPWICNDAGMALRVVPDDVRAARLYASRGTLDRGLLRLWDRLCDDLKPDLIIDVGANYGEVAFSRQYAWKPRIELFEPLPEVCECLEQTIKRNRINGATVHCVAASCGSSERDLFISTKGSGRSSLIQDSVHSRRVRVRTVAIDDVLEGAPSVVAKIDVEGHEPAVLKGMKGLISGSERCAIVCEFHLLDASDIAELTTQYAAFIVDRYTLDTTQLSPETYAHELATRNPEIILKDLLLVPRDQGRSSGDPAYPC